MSVKFSESVKEERSVPLVEGQKKLHRTCDALAESQKKRVSRAAQELGAGGGILGRRYGGTNITGPVPGSTRSSDSV